MNCRHCGHRLENVFLDLGHAPPSNAYLDEASLHLPEITYPLKLYVCAECWLVQTEDHARADQLFHSNYAYFSSTSQTWLEHARRYFEMAQRRFALDTRSHVVEVASNDGYLLRHFVEAGIPCLGIEPTASTAAAAEALNIPVKREFFGLAVGKALAKEEGAADLIVANNVYAHVPDINDFTLGLKAALKRGGTITLEFPHLLRMIEETQFDTSYHEHFSYLSLYTVERIFATVGLRIFDVEELTTHGGSLRIYAGHLNDSRQNTEAVGRILEDEASKGLRSIEAYSTFQARAERIKNDLVIFLIEQKRNGHKVAAYGAAAKGNTLLNFAGVKRDLVEYVCDAAPSKQEKYMPGSHIPILAPCELRERRPDTVLILPWNIAHEVMQQQRIVRDWGGRFAVALPRLQFCDC
jgi:SAM-dependent methyltransferase